MARSLRTPRRAQASLAVAVVMATGVLAAAPASGQTAPGEASTDTSTTTSSTTTTTPGSTTTTTAAPPVTVDLGNGEVGVLPPGAEDPDPPETPSAGVAGPAPADGEREVPEELAVAVLPDPTPGLNAALAAIEVTRARTALAEAEEGRRSAEEAVRAAFDRRAGAVAARRAAGEDVVGTHELVGQLAVNAVIYGNIAEIEPVLGPPTLDHLRDVEVSDVVADELFGDLDDARAEYRDAVDAELRATARLTRTVRAARLVRADYLRLRTDLADAVRRADEARRRAGPTILGSATLDAADLVAWHRTYYPSEPAVAPIERIVEAYLEIGEEEGVAGDIAFAQAVLETGGFRSGHARKFNFAGIGAYDHCSPECSFAFPDLDAGVRAHIHLLRAYADPGLTSAQLASSPNPRVAPERVGVRGCCERWTELTGVWATDPNYDRKVLGIYRLMVETARERDRARA